MTQQEFYRQKIQELRLIDDIFMSKVFENKACTELLIRIILDDPTLIVQDVQTQYEIKNLAGRSVRLDILAHDSTGRCCNIEVQRASAGAQPRRARYNSAMLDASCTIKGESFDQLPEQYIIFITEADPLGGDLPIYHIDRTIRETGTLFGDQTHVIFVTGTHQGPDALGRLMHDFFCKEPEEMYYQALADEATHYKRKTEGVNVMCQIMDEIEARGIAKGIAKGRAEGKAETIYSCMEALGKSADEDMDMLRILPDERALYHKLLDQMSQQS